MAPFSQKPIFTRFKVDWHSRPTIRTHQIYIPPSILGAQSREEADFRVRPPRSRQWQGSRRRRTRHHRAASPFSTAPSHIGSRAARPRGPIPRILPAIAAAEPMIRDMVGPFRQSSCVRPANGVLAPHGTGNVALVLYFPSLSTPD